MQNTSHAVMAQRVEPKDSADDFPTPPWAARALLEHVLRNPGELATMTCLEPACGAGHMAKVLKEYFGGPRVVASPSRAAVDCSGRPAPETAGRTRNSCTNEETECETARRHRAT